MGLAAGDLNRKINIERRASGEDASGQPIDTWELVASVSANPKGATGMASVRAQMAGGVPESINAYSFRIRYRTGIDAGMRVVYDGEPFEIKNVRMDFERKEWTDLVCAQGGNDG